MRRRSLRRNDAPAPRLLLALARGEAISPAGEQVWREAIALAELHGIAPLLHEQLQKKELRGVPESARAELRAARISELVREEKRARALDRALSSLGGVARSQATEPRADVAPDKTALRVLLLKGAASARTLYAAPELRPRSDLDLLVSPEDRDEALSRLARHGYQQHEKTRGTREDESDWHERTLIHPDAPDEQLDLHFALAQAERHRLDARRLFGASVPEPALGAAARVSSDVVPRILPAEEAALVCAHSLALHELTAPLIALTDFAILLARADLAKLVATAREVRLLRALYVSAALLARLGPPAFRSSSLFARVAVCAPFSLCGARVDPLQLAGLMSATGLSLPARRLLRAAAAGYDLARAPQPRASQLWRKALFIDRPLDAVRFAASHARRTLLRSLDKRRNAG